MSKPGQKWHFFMFLPVSDHVSEISPPKATKSRPVRPFTTNAFWYPKIYIKKVKKEVINRSQWHFKNYFFARFRLSVEDYVAEGDKIKGYRSKKFI